MPFQDITNTLNTALAQKSSSHVLRNVERKSQLPVVKKPIEKATSKADDCKIANIEEFFSDILQLNDGELRNEKLEHLADILKALPKTWKIQETKKINHKIQKKNPPRAKKQLSSRENFAKRICRAWKDSKTTRRITLEKFEKGKPFPTDKRIFQLSC